MENFISYKILKEKNLIIEYYSGQILVEDFLKLHKNKAENKDFHPNLNLLIDFRDAEIHLEKDDVLRMVQFHKSNPRLFGERNAAHITKTPNQVVAGINFDRYNDELPIKIRIFSSLEASLSWVGLAADDQPMIQKHLDELKAKENNI